MMTMGDTREPYSRVSMIAWTDYFRLVFFPRIETSKEWMGKKSLDNDRGGKKGHRTHSICPLCLFVFILCTSLLILSASPNAKVLLLHGFSCIIVFRMHTHATAYTHNTYTYTVVEFLCCTTHRIFRPPSVISLLLHQLQLQHMYA